MEENKNYEIVNEPCNYIFSHIEGNQEVWICTECGDEIKKPHTYVVNEPKEYNISDESVTITPCQRDINEHTYVRAQDGYPYTDEPNNDVEYESEDSQVKHR